MWANASWKGNLFPADAKSDEYLYYYSRVFNTVEGNTSFYADPSPEQVQKWQEQTPDNFRFTFKFPQRFTHHQQLNIICCRICSAISKAKIAPNATIIFVVAWRNSLVGTGRTISSLT